MDPLYDLAYHWDYALAGPLLNMWLGMVLVIAAVIEAVIGPIQIVLRIITAPFRSGSPPAASGQTPRRPSDDPDMIAYHEDGRPLQTKTRIIAFQFAPAPWRLVIALALISGVVLTMTNASKLDDASVLVPEGSGLTVEASNWSVYWFTPGVHADSVRVTGNGWDASFEYLSLHVYEEFSYWGSVSEVTGTIGERLTTTDQALDSSIDQGTGYGMNLHNINVQTAEGTAVVLDDVEVVNYHPGLPWAQRFIRRTQRSESPVAPYRMWYSSWSGSQEFNLGPIEAASLRELFGTRLDVPDHARLSLHGWCRPVTYPSDALTVELTVTYEGTELAADVRRVIDALGKEGVGSHQTGVQIRSDEVIGDEVTLQWTVPSAPPASGDDLLDVLPWAAIADALQ